MIKSHVTAATTGVMSLKIRESRKRPTFNNQQAYICNGKEHQEEVKLQQQNLKRNNQYCTLGSMWNKYNNTTIYNWLPVSVKTNKYKMPAWQYRLSARRRNSLMCLCARKHVYTHYQVTVCSRQALWSTVALVWNHLHLSFLRLNFDVSCQQFISLLLFP